MSEEVEALLKLHGYIWDNLLDGFRRVRRIGQESLDQYLHKAPNVISFEELDDHGFVRTGHDAARPADADAGAETGWQRSALETSQPGIFAVGDVRSGSTKRVAAAVGEGAIAIRLAFERMRPT